MLSPGEPKGALQELRVWVDKSTHEGHNWSLKARGARADLSSLLPSGGQPADG